MANFQLILILLDPFLKEAGTLPHAGNYMDATYSVFHVPSRDFSLCVCGINVSIGSNHEHKTKKQLQAKTRAVE